MRTFSLAALVLVATAAAGCSRGEQDAKPQAERAAVQAQLDAVRRVRDAVAANAPDTTVIKHSADASAAGGRTRQLNQDGPGLEIIRTLDAALAAYTDAHVERSSAKEMAEIEAKAKAELPADAPELPKLAPSTAPAANATKGDEALLKAEAAMIAWK